MKSFLIDICLVGLFIFMVNGVLNDHKIQNHIFDREIKHFEAAVDSGKTIQQDYGVVSEEHENIMSKAIRSISNVCISTIETIVLIISNIISMLM